MRKLLIGLVSLGSFGILSYLDGFKTIKILIFSLLFICHSTASSYSNELVLIEEIPLIYQYPELPTGCEATSLAMLLQYYGVDVQKTDIAKLLPRAPMPQEVSGINQTLHPNSAFIGNPFTYEGYGVYLPPLLDIINTYLPNQGVDLTHSDFSYLLELLDQGIPIITWVTMNMKPAYLTHTWETPSGPFTWVAPEHTVLIVGYDNSYIYTHDPLNGRATYKLEIFISSWTSLGKQALTILPSDECIR